MTIPIYQTDNIIINIIKEILELQDISLVHNDILDKYKRELCKKKKEIKKKHKELKTFRSFFFSSLFRDFLNRKNKIKNGTLKQLFRIKEIKQLLNNSGEIKENLCCESFFIS
jgi:hypothetical protein